MQKDNAELLSPAAAAERLGVTENWLEDARLRKVGPAYLRLGYRTVRYSGADLDAFIAARRQVPA